MATNDESVGRKERCPGTRCGNKMFAPEDLCQDGYCRACHVSLGWEECCDGSWVERQRAAAGLPPSADIIGGS